MTGVAERLLLAAVVIALSVLIARVLSARTRHRATTAIATAGPAPGARVLAFHARWCSACAAQRQQVDDLDGVEVRYIDVESDEGAARRHGVRSLPTTIVVGPDGAVAAVNHGLVTTATLRSQLAGVAGS